SDSLTRGVIGRERVQAQSRISATARIDARERSALSCASGRERSLGILGGNCLRVPGETLRSFRFLIGEKKCLSRKGGKEALMRAGLLLSIIALVGCGSGSDMYSRDGQALDLSPELPVTIGLTGDTFSVTFSGEDADLSFAADTTRFGCFTTGGGWI